MSRTIIGKKRKIYYVISHVHKSLAFEWIAVRLKPYYDLTFVLFNAHDTPLENFLKQNEIRVVRMPYVGKRDIPKTFFNFLWLLIKERPAIVHAHLFDATLIALIAGWLVGIKKRIYTRHNSTYHHLYHPKSVKYDRLTNFLSTHIISISQATDKVLAEMEGVPLQKIEKIHHGFDLSDFLFSDKKRENNVQLRWQIPSSDPRVGVIARHIEWKGIQYIVPAFKKFLQSYPDACLILANASGPYHETILHLLKDIPSRNFVLIPFEEDIAPLYKLFDMYIHTPIDATCEAFGQTYVEALASQVPCIFSLSGVAAEFVEHKKNALVVPFQNSGSIYESMMLLWNEKNLRALLAENGKQAVTSMFDISTMVTKLKELYDR
jgi:glycosyltransferase involved in cell wall biosynthesis